MEPDVIHQDTVGTCAFIDVLEEAAVRRTTVNVTLRDGRQFEDVAIDVVTRDGENRVVFRDHGQLSASQVMSMTRARPAARSMRDRP
jgi:transcriptional antiterminator Rof (Rho-off)